MKKNHAGGGNGGASNVDATPLESATQNAAQGPRKKKNFRPRDVPHVVRNSDEPFLVVHKPAFWKCELPISESEPETLGGWLQKRGEEFRIANELFEISVNPAISGDTGFGALCHRLDRETSGPMIVAKTREAYDQLRVQFHRKTVVKAYMCLVHGRMGYDAHGPDGNVVAVSGTIKNYIRTVRSSVSTWSEVVQEKCSDAEVAHTDYQVLGWYSRTTKNEAGLESEVLYYSLVACLIHTGRTHQIRVHMQFLGHPVVQDDKYGPDCADAQEGVRAGLVNSTKRHESYRPTPKILCPRLFLHAFYLKFQNPKTMGDIEIRSPLPDDLRLAIRSAEFLLEKVVCEGITVGAKTLSGAWLQEGSYDKIAWLDWRHELVDVIPEFRLRRAVERLLEGASENELSLASINDRLRKEMQKPTHQRMLSLIGLEMQKRKNGDVVDMELLQQWSCFDFYSRAGTDGIVVYMSVEQELAELREKKQAAIENEDFELAESLKTLLNGLLSNQQRQLERRKNISKSSAPNMTSSTMFPDLPIAPSKALTGQGKKKGQIHSQTNVESGTHPPPENPPAAAIQSPEDNADEGEAVQKKGLKKKGPKKMGLGDFLARQEAEKKAASNRNTAWGSIEKPPPPTLSNDAVGPSTLGKGKGSSATGSPDSKEKETVHSPEQAHSVVESRTSGDSLMASQMNQSVASEPFAASTTKDQATKSTAAKTVGGGHRIAEVAVSAGPPKIGTEQKRKGPKNLLIFQAPPRRHASDPGVEQNPIGSDNEFDDDSGNGRMSKGVGKSKGNGNLFLKSCEPDINGRRASDLQEANGSAKKVAATNDPQRKWVDKFLDAMREKKKTAMELAPLLELVPEFAKAMNSPPPKELERLAHRFFVLRNDFFSVTEKQQIPNQLGQYNQRALELITESFKQRSPATFKSDLNLVFPLPPYVSCPIVL